MREVFRKSWNKIRYYKNVKSYCTDHKKRVNNTIYEPVGKVRSLNVGGHDPLKEHYKETIEGRKKNRR